MTNRPFTALLAFAVLTLAVPAANAAGTHTHDGNAAATYELRLNDGKKWETDTSLRTGMTNIRGAMADVLPAIHDASLPAAGYQVLARRIEGEINYMVENCDLSPEADEQLHAVIGSILEGIDAMESPATARDGAVTIVQALDAYGDHFAHESWVPLKH